MATFPSSIFSFDTLKLKPISFPKATAAAVVLVLGAEAGLHLLESRLPEAVTWGGGETSVKVAQAERFAASGQAPLDVLVAGPSHASLGISPGAMKSLPEAASWRVYNGGLNGRTYSVVNFVSEQVYEPKLKPRAVVLTASPVILNSNNRWMERNTTEFFAAPMPKALTSRGLWRQWRLFLAEKVSLFKYRRRGTRLSEGFLGGRRIIDEYGFHPAEGLWNEESREYLFSGDHPYGEIMSTIAFGGPSADAFVDMVRRLRTAEIPVVVVNMPFRKALLKLSPHGEEEYATFLDHMRRLEADLGFTWLDYHAEFPMDDIDFRDVDHLNPDGARKLSIRLARDLIGLIPSLTKA